MTDFEQDVFKAVLAIPFGDVRTYKWVACRIGRPKAYRAVANVLAKNPYPLLVPCHRVVRSDGDYGGYLFGSRAKKNLIKLEKKIKDMIK
ncbi:MAG: methylated-DNA--[protein]-cysteine S-methyltransferase [Candidatus Omnitrophica bacterium]|jgi:O-6-methylguanine DNA methyltransferase|nr:methylated-DNA--[protein]-cysteine S-methyltransferase [Candidatus Omnitrophota bacterium]MDD5081519.1 methylated-DNA--[protein]-cysteine S-methyltransferase [Candidatus Omnitrophota bacterium]MDD5441445.1 methylated-DNA--[protein]-cysteine S-methyltransferase [Candidatus Omnitrophota bacterium]